MRKLRRKTFALTIIISAIFALSSSAQENVKVTQDSKIMELLKLKNKMNNSATQNDTYKIQIFYGTSDEAKKKNAAFKKDFKDIETTIVFTSPTFKVWAGNYKMRIHAEKALVEIKKKYPTALLIKPSK